MKLITKLACLLGSMAMPYLTQAQQVGDFRSNASGDWSNQLERATWQQFQVIGGASWRITAQSDISGTTGNTISQASYSPGGTWKNATVPATVLTSYINNGTEPNPNTNLNIYNVNKSTYNKPYWYRATFTIPAAFSGRTVWLNFDGTNKKAEIFINGTQVANNLGHVARQKIKFTPVAGTNCIAVLVSTPFFIKNTHGLANYESPTYICSQGWDWMPQIPGLNCGITDDVYLSSSGAITVEDPWIRPQLPAPYNNATINIRTELRNHTGSSVTGNWTGTISPGGQTFTVNNVTIPANSKISRSTDVTVSNPQLWWPNGYGAQNLYKCYMEFRVSGALSDSATRQFGVRNVTWNKTANNEPMKITVNGQPIFCKGGNWGMSEYLLRSRGAEYDVRVKLHQQMNFNMIRNWTGEVTDDEFYDACDKYGIMIFDDFWLNNSGWINDADTVQFRNNCVEKIKKVRNHASLVLFCGANEGVPGYGLDSKENRIMQESLNVHDNNGDHWYQPRSNNRSVPGVGPYLSGSGNWSNEHPSHYFLYPANGYAESANSYSFRSEIGTAVIPNAESIRKFITNSGDQWPGGNLWDNNMWKFHMFGKADSLGSGSDPEKYVNTINRYYGTSSNLDQFTKKAQMLNVETNKAIFEGWQDRMFNDATGVLLWMSQSAYPSMIWQTYDYYFDLTGAYIGSKQACEPVHIQWNSATNSVKGINNQNGALWGLRAESMVYNKAGKIIPGYYQRSDISMSPNSVYNAHNLFGTLISAGKNISASSQQGSFPAWHVNDGKIRTRWCANTNGTGEWIQMDLGSNQNVNGVRISWEYSAPSTYKIQTSTGSGGPWADAISVTNSGGVNNLHFNSVNCRYVRIQPTATSPYPHSLWEFEVFAPVTNNVATMNKDVSASSTAGGFTTQAATDGNTGTRWSSGYGNDNENFTIDMGTSLAVIGTKINWEAAYATSYKIQVSNSLSGPWTDAITVTGNGGGTDSRTFGAVSGRYVRMQGLTRSLSPWGYSMWEFEVYTRDPAPLTDVSFIKLRLTDGGGTNVYSENFYWYGQQNYQGLNSMPGIGASLTKSGATSTSLPNGNTQLTYTVSNTSNSNAAFGVRAQLLNGSGQQILPAYFSDSYFSLMQGETKQLRVEVSPAVLGGSYTLDLKPYNP